jgi:hypothetical protein
MMLKANFLDSFVTLYENGLTQLGSSPVGFDPGHRTPLIPLSCI